MSSPTTPPRAAEKDAPQSLAGRLLAREHERHAGRLACIQRMHTRLALLEALLPAITAAGISLDLEDVTDWGGKELWLGSGLFDRTRNARLANALVASGMRVEKRTESDYGERDVMLCLVKGRLRISLSIDGRGKHLLEVPACA